MPRFAANVSQLFTEWPFLERFEAAAAAGFEAVEFLFPYDHEAGEVAGAIADAGVRPVLLNTPPGDWEAGERGLAALPGREDEFRRAFARAVAYAKRLGVPKVHVMAGIVGPDGSVAEAETVFLENLAQAATTAAKEGLRLMLEPINDRDVPGYFLTRCDQARRVIEMIGARNLFLQFDCYHVQVMEGEIESRFRMNLDLIRHVQISGLPGRHEPDERQDIDYPYLFECIDDSGYDGWVACEYQPRATTLEGLAWAAQYGIGQRR